MMAKKRMSKAEQKLAEEIGAAPSDPKLPKPSRKSAPKPKARKNAKPTVSGKLTTKEQARSLWAPRVTPKRKSLKKK
jgi:hypothetical protein